MKSRLCLIPAALLLAVLAARADDQTAVAARIAARADAATIEADAAGRIVRLALSNHQQHRAANDKTMLGRPGLTDADLPELLQLTGLRALFIEKQALTAAGYARLAALTALEDVRIHYPGDRFVYAHHKLPPIEAGFATCVDALPPGLRHLELKHGFDVKGDGGLVLAGLKPRPALRKLELDTAFATPAAVAFILGSPQLEDLQLHRTTMGDGDVQRLFAALPRLRILELRPASPAADPIRSHSLRGLRAHPALERLYLSLEWGPLSWKDGLDHLATIPTLKLLSVAGLKPALTPDSPALLAFRKARPDVSINLGPPAQNVNAGIPANTGRDAETTWGITQ